MAGFKLPRAKQAKIDKMGRLLSGENSEKFGENFERILRVFVENFSRTNIRSVTVRQTDRQTDNANPREACASKKSEK